MSPEDLAAMLEAAGICPHCLRRYEADGSHIAPSGARIPAKPEPVTA